METARIGKVISKLETITKQWSLPVVALMAQENKNPFAILVVSILSLRTKEEQTAPAAKKLLSLACTSKEMAKLSENTIAKTIYPVGFYRNKARDILEISRKLEAEYNGVVPSSIDELLCFKGVGRKTANLVVIVAYKKAGICVDIHVHRISNRLGFVATKTPDETEFALRGKLPQKHWHKYNPLMVAFGRNICTPTSPHCSICPINTLCEKKGVTKNR
ncbi:MAG: endonuclease III [Deltaproteobacteria bacterium]